MNIKSIIAGSILTAFFAATSANAGDNDYLTTAVDTSPTTQPFVISHAFLLTTMVAADEVDVDDELENR